MKTDLNSDLHLVPFMLGNGWEMKDMVWVNRNGQMEHIMRVVGKIIK